LLDTAGLVRGMSRAGNCSDNAKIESFWSTLKTKTDRDVVIPATRKEAELAVFDYIEAFYNSKRRRSSLGQISPVAFEQQYEKLKSSDSGSAFSRQAHHHPSGARSWSAPSPRFRAPSW
jgi:transposase InsO family protein